MKYVLEILVVLTTIGSWMRMYLTGGAEPWKKAAYAIDAVLGVALAALAVMAVRKYNKQK